MRTLISIALVLACLANAHAQDTTSLQLDGKLSAQWNDSNASKLGPLAQANTLQDGIANLPGSGATFQAELRARGNNWNAIATLQHEQLADGTTQSQSWVNELVATHDAGNWQFSLGRKVVGWDVGYAFRPNDIVQQETRRTLISTTAQGRPVAMAEYFDAESAWSLVLVNPTSGAERLAGAEPAFAARFYQRDGAVDWHAFVRAADRTGSSVGAAVAWVAGDALELHASARLLEHADGLSGPPDAGTLATRSLWQQRLLERSTQALIGGTWTHESQLSVLFEAWWDGTALSPDQWTQWKARNQYLTGLAGSGVPIGAVAANLAWQNDAFGASNGLHRSNLYARLSWQRDAWQPALDLLYHPVDGGALVTASLLYKGDRAQWQAGLRHSVGPSDAVLMQLPTRGQAYLLASWAF